MYYFGARYYDPELGVWGAVDPVKDGWFVYGYVNGNPIMFIDSTGEYGALASALWGIASGAIGGAMYGGVIGGIASSSQGGDFWEGFGKGALIGGISGAAFGGIYGGVAGIGETYVGLSGMGKQFVDLTWGLPNTVVGFTFGMADVGIGKIANYFGSAGDYGIAFHKGMGAMQLKGPVLGAGGAYRTVGPVIWGEGTIASGSKLLTHELFHTAQARMLGPAFLPTYVTNYAANIVAEPFVGLAEKAMGKPYSFGDIFWNAYARPYNILEFWAQTAFPPL